MVTAAIQMQKSTMTAANSPNQQKITARDAVGLPNPGDTDIDLLRKMAPNRKTAPQMSPRMLIADSSPMKIYRPETSQILDISMGDSVTTRNGKGMGSQSPLPSTNLGGAIKHQHKDGARNHEAQDDNAD